MEKQHPQKLVITTKDGEVFRVPPEGTLGLLALGYKGLIAWRQVRMQYTRLLKEQQEKNAAQNTAEENKS